VEEKNLAFCDPFHASSPKDAARIIRDSKLEYLGETVLSGHRCHRIRAWMAGDQSDHVPGRFLEWAIDAETFLPRRVETILLSSLRSDFTIDFSYSRMNQPIPVDEFRPENDLGDPTSTVKLEPLAGGYMRHFLNVRDGSDGRMSVRWGMKGQKGSSSIGLN